MVVVLDFFHPFLFFCFFCFFTAQARAFRPHPRAPLMIVQNRPRIKTNKDHYYYRHRPPPLRTL